MPFLPVEPEQLQLRHPDASIVTQSRLQPDTSNGGHPPALSPKLFSVPVELVPPGVAVKNYTINIR